MALSLREFRCHSCHHLLFKGLLVESEIEIKCKACSELNVFKSSQYNELLCAIPICPGRVAIGTQKKK